VTFDPEYVRFVLNENFEDAKTRLLPPLMAIHYAHLVMLTEQGIVPAAEAAAIRRGLDGIDLAAVRAARYDGSCEDLFFFVDRLIVGACGEEVAGRLHTARSRNDIDMTMYRVAQRALILELVEGACALRQALLGISARYPDAIFPAHTHTQAAQPTTIAHYLLAVVEQLERDTVRLRAAYASTNQSPLGACAITGTGFPIDRARTAGLLGFDGVTGNTYGSIATVDYLLEAVSATSVLLTGLGRVVQDLLLWCTREVGYLRLSDGFVQCSSIMPQKRNPVALEHARAIASKALGQAGGIFVAVHNTPFGDIVDTEDDLQPLVFAMFRDAARAVRLVGAAMAHAEFDTRRMAERAREGWITVTELADTLTRHHGVAFKVSHRIAVRLVAEARRRPEAALRDVLRDLTAAELGTAIEYDADALARILSPEYFVSVRATPGGPAAERVAEALAASQGALEGDLAWLAATTTRLRDAEARLEAAAALLDVSADAGR
jgi:argininosuccinate lyase